MKKNKSISLLEIAKLIVKEQIVIVDDYHGILSPDSLTKIYKKEMDEEEIEANYSGWNFIVDGHHFAVEGVKVFKLNPVEVNI